MAQKISIPKVLPPLDAAMILFSQFIATPIELLAGYRPSELFSIQQDVDRAWFVGSAAWMPLVRCKAWSSEKSDIDIAFGIPGSAQIFGEQVKRMLENKGEEIFIEENKWEGPKLCRKVNKRMKPFLDAWDIPDGHTIGEHIWSFPRNHERCAIMVGACNGEVSAVTRLVDLPTRVRLPKKKKEKEANTVPYSSYWDEGS